MKLGNRILSLALALALCLGLGGVNARGDAPTAAEKAAELTALGLFRGKADEQGNLSPALGDAATRAEAATMLIRLMGKEEKAAAQYAAGALRCNFTDVAFWAAPNVAWLYEAGYVNGSGGDYYGAAETVTAQQFAAMVLRSLGYNELDGDFSYAGALSFAVSKGVLTRAQADAWQRDFRREGMVEMSYNALYLNLRDSTLTLMDKLTRDGVFRNIDMSVAATPALSLSLKYSAGGKTNPTYFEEKAFGNAVCGDVDGDGKPEIVYGIRSVFCIDAATGDLKWRAPSGHDVTEGLDPNFDSMGEAFTYIPFQILDYDGDGQLDIFTVTNIAGTTQCNIAVYDGFGRFKAHWTTDRRVWACCVSDLDGDGRCEVAIGYGVGEPGMYGTPSVYLYENDGTLRWAEPCRYGLFSDSITAADLDRDGRKELVLLYDENFIVAFHADGTHVTTSAFGGGPWSDVVFYEGGDDYGKNIYEHHTREDTIGLMGTHSGVAADDLDGDGRTEIVGVAMFADISVVERNMAANAGDSFADSVRYFAPFILNADRTRFKNAARGWDWSYIPTDLGAPVALESEVLNEPSLRPTLADMDGDGVKEILYGSYDGKVHCFHLDGTEHGAWPFALCGRGSTVLSYASQPVAADVNGDGKPEVIFATYTQSDQTAERGKLYVLDYSGKVLAETLLPVMFAQSADVYYPNGSQTAPCVADFDGDGQLEIAVATYSCGVCVYELS